MKNAIKLFALLLTIALAQPATAKLNVFACEPEWGALAKELGGNALKIYTATTGKQDPHHIQARPSLLAKARQADLLICTGAELEIGWLPILLRKTGNPRIQPGRLGYFMATDYVRLRDIPSYLDRSEGDIHAAGNPHIQTDPHNIARVAKVLAQRLAELDPANAADYQNRYQNFEKRWQAAVRHWEKQAAVLKDVPIVVHHKSWVYLEHWLGLKEIATLEPKPGIPPSSWHLARVLKQLKRQPAKMVIYAAYQESRPAHWLSRKAGIPVVELPFTVGGTREAKDLFALFDETLKRLRGAVK
ncbi:MAG: zinc ABC transporter substrate-binding protein [Pseudomonadota bacterium]